MSSATSRASKKRERLAQDFKKYERLAKTADDLSYIMRTTQLYKEGKIEKFIRQRTSSNQSSTPKPQKRQPSGS